MAEQTPVDRQTALLAARDYHVAECIDMHGDPGEDGRGPECCWHSAVAHALSVALYGPVRPRVDAETKAEAEALIRICETGAGLHLHQQSEVAELLSRFVLGEAEGLTVKENNDD